ncbi:hypothetical protein [Lentibacillus sp. CBA3610]|uniref:oxidoreductase n=1 Tax=Lentibacillus sp. CBA3610 TaxID=2518176 RepID=UPI0020D21532|nr:hypothetical protein [Lentibacillus sp. CBA3610]
MLVQSGRRERTIGPRALEDGEIKGIIHAYGEGARRAIQAGSTGVKSNGANGYLIHQFFLLIKSS